MASSSSSSSILAILSLLAFNLIFVIDRLTGLGVDIAGMNAIARRAVERVEAHFLGLGSGGQHRHRPEGTGSVNDLRRASILDL